MFTCKKCHATTFGQVEHDAGDWIVRCSVCGAKNILATGFISKVEVPAFEISGWRD
jgi:hypothetical protein